jgi:hypothetical protein
MASITKRTIFLLIASTASTFVTLMFAFLRFRHSLEETEQSIFVLLWVVLALTILLLFGAIAIGLRSAARLHLRFTLIDRLLGQEGEEQEEAAASRVSWRNLLLVTSVGGVFLSGYMVGATLLFDMISPDTVQFFPLREQSYMLAALFHHSISGEVIMRLFLFSSLALILYRLRVPKRVALWIAVVYSALIAVVLTAPALESLSSIGSSLSFARMLSIYFIPHMVYAVVFWKRSFLYAVCLHAMTFLLYDWVAVHFFL